MERNRRRQGRTPRQDPSLLQRINPDVAGIDCGASEHYVAVPAGRDPNPVQSFRTFTADLHRLADWLKACGVRSVAMESTGVYWIAVFEILEARGFEVLLTNARQVKNVPGRKTDVTDCEWLRELHSVGLLRSSFRPAEALAALRAYLRHRTKLVEATNDVIQRMQKALVQMNVLLPQVITDVTGVTGMAILHDIVDGRTDPAHLVKHRDPRCHASPEAFVAALTGNYRPEYVFVLKQNLEIFEYYQRQLAECDVAIKSHLETIVARAKPPTTELPQRRSKRPASGNEPRFDVRAYLHQLTGTDLSQIDGIGPYLALRIISEIGVDMTRWPTERHFTSWLTLAPQNRISGGRLLSSRTPASANRAAAMLRVAAMSLARTQTALGAFYRRLAARVGKAKANTATARKLAILIYRTLQGELAYHDPGPDAYDARQRQRVTRRLQKQASRLGFTLVPIGGAVPAPVGVS